MAISLVNSHHCAKNFSKIFQMKPLSLTDYYKNRIDLCIRLLQSQIIDLETIKNLVSNPHIPITNMFMECNQLDPLVEQINALTTDELTTIENEVGFHRLTEFEQLKEKYHSRLLVLNSLNTNKKIATKNYNDELLKDEDEEK